MPLMNSAPGSLGVADGLLRRNCLGFLLTTLVVAALAGCATPPPPQASPIDPAPLLHDELFASSSPTFGAEEIFSLSDPMRQYLRNQILSQSRSNGLQGGLVAALYSGVQLKLEYDASTTRTAAEAFNSRAGNCLSLVVMTAAFAKELGLDVRYQSAYVEETWSRNGNLLLRAGHVNVTLGPRLQDRASRLARGITIDFLPSHEAQNVRAREISEKTIVAMFMNNRAVEAVVRGQLDDAYAWSRAAVLQSPEFLPAYNTLGIVYARHGHPEFAETTYRHVLERDPKHTRAMANLAELYAATGRETEAATLRTTLAQLEPEPPLYYYHQGMLAMQRSDYKSALNLFAREVARNGYTTEVSYWLGIVYYRLGDPDMAKKHLSYALDSTTSSKDRDFYSAKLARLKSGAQ
jgi:tetratricopeptide (TPR) repeat protein